MPISNCEKCGAVFLRGDRPICPQCAQKEEAEFQMAVEWLRANPGKTVADLSENTGINSSDILRWLREKRLLFSGTGHSLSCKKCGKIIDTGTFCEACRTSLSQDIGGDKSAAPGVRKEAGPGGGMHYNRRLRGRRR